MKNRVMSALALSLAIAGGLASPLRADTTLEKDNKNDIEKSYTENANRVFRYGRITPKGLEPEPKNPIIANFFHQVRLADELGSGVRNLYHYVKIYSNAEPVFDEDDVFRLIVPLNDEYSADRAFEGELSQTLRLRMHHVQGCRRVQHVPAPLPLLLRQHQQRRGVGHLEAAP